VFILAHIVVVPGSRTKRTECGCNKARGYEAINGDIENCQLVSGM